MKNDFKVSLIVSTYNSPRFLELCLKSICNQKRLPDEVLIGDDGSTSETKAVIDKFKEIFPVPLLHIWQADEGFQLAKIRNKCIARAKYDYIIQIDGDIVLHPYFVQDHILKACPGYFVVGSRAKLNPDSFRDINKLGYDQSTFLANRGQKKNECNEVLIPFLTLSSLQTAGFVLWQGVQCCRLEKGFNIDQRI